MPQLVANHQRIQLSRLQSFNYYYITLLFGVLFLILSVALLVAHFIATSNAPLGNKNISYLLFLLLLTATSMSYLFLRSQLKIHKIETTLTWEQLIYKLTQQKLPEGWQVDFYSDTQIIYAIKQHKGNFLLKAEQLVLMQIDDQIVYSHLNTPFETNVFPTLNKKHKGTLLRIIQS